MHAFVIKHELIVARLLDTHGQSLITLSSLSPSPLTHGPGTYSTGRSHLCQASIRRHDIFPFPLNMRIWRVKLPPQAYVPMTTRNHHFLCHGQDRRALSILNDAHCQQMDSNRALMVRLSSSTLRICYHLLCSIHTAPCWVGERHKKISGLAWWGPHIGQSSHQATTAQSIVYCTRYLEDQHTTIWSVNHQAWMTSTMEPVITVVKNNRCAQACRYSGHQMVSSYGDEGYSNTWQSTKGLNRFPPWWQQISTYLCF